MKHQKSRSEGGEKGEVNKGLQPQVKIKAWREKKILISAALDSPFPISEGEK